MGVKYSTKIDKMPYIKNTAKRLNNKKVQVGVFGGEQAYLAAIHEYGCNITVTPKMRAYLHYNGLHLSPDTTVIKIPERSFLRTGHDLNADRIMEQTARAIGQVLAGKMSVDDLFELYGQQMTTAIKKYAVQLKSPANHPYTIEQKGSSNPLVDTGDMIEHVSWNVEG